MQLLTICESPLCVGISRMGVVDAFWQQTIGEIGDSLVALQVPVWNILYLLQYYHLTYPPFSPFLVLGSLLSETMFSVLRLVVNLSFFFALCPCMVQPFSSFFYLIFLHFPWDSCSTMSPDPRTDFMVSFLLQVPFHHYPAVELSLPQQSYVQFRSFFFFFFLCINYISSSWPALFQISCKTNPDSHSPNYLHFSSSYPIII